MSYREAFKQVLAHQDVSPVPYSVKFTVEARERYATHLGRPFDPILDTGSYVVAPSHSLTGDIPPENIDAFLEVARNQTG